MLVFGFEPSQKLPMPDYQFIDLSSSAPACAALQGAARIGVDTEFMREKTYYAQLCLVQFAVGNDYWCADPLPASDLQPFWDALLAPAWVLHSGRQDLEVVQQSSGRLPRELFDTQIAAALLGYPPQMGYANLVAELFNVDLAKSQTRADWSRRPLSAAELEYAAEDVMYLLQAYEVLCERLDTLGRLDWARQDSADLLDPSLYSNNFDAAVDRVKGARNLRGRARRAAELLATWRERRAEKSDKPRQWIVRDAVLLAIAEKNPADAAALAKIDNISPGLVRRNADELLELLKSAQTGSDDYEPPGRPDDAQKALLKSLQKTVAACARQMDIPAEVLAPRRELAAAVAGERQLRLFRGWRGELLGTEISQSLD
jgi:ribonuclease D